MTTTIVVVVAGGAPRLVDVDESQGAEHRGAIDLTIIARPYRRLPGGGGGGGGSVLANHDDEDIVDDDGVR